MTCPRSAQPEEVSTQLAPAAPPAFTLRVYAHMLPSSHDRARAVIDDRFASFMITEQRRNSIRP